MKIIETGIIKRKFETKTHDVIYEMFFLEEKHLPDVMKLQELIVNNVNNTEVFNSSSKDIMLENINKKGKIIGVFSENELIAYRAVYFPDINEKQFNFAYDINLPQDEIEQIANFQVIVVHPEFRGNQLGQKLNNHALNLLKNLNFTHVFATVSPYNYYNIKLLINSGFMIKAIKCKYGNKLRYIVHQNLKTPCKFLHTKEVVFKNIEIEKQRELIEQGYFGIKIQNKKIDHFEIVYI